MYELNLVPFNLDLYYDKIVEIVSKKLGWVNYKKAVFEFANERDNCLLELERVFDPKNS